MYSQAMKERKRKGAMDTERKNWIQLHSKANLEMHPCGEK